MKLTIEQKTGLFHMLVDKDLYTVGLEYGFDKHYKDAKAVKGAVYRNYSEVKNNPEEFGIQPMTYNKVINAMSSRAVSKPAVNNVSLREKMEDVDIKEIVLSNRDKIALLLGRKLDDIGSSKKKLSATPLGTLSLAFCQIFDKGQIVQGEATQHIAHLAKIEDGLSAKDLLEAVIIQRESTISKKNS